MGGYSTVRSVYLVNKVIKISNLDKNSLDKAGHFLITKIMLSSHVRAQSGDFLSRFSSYIIMLRTSA
jgi:hypothetical protein